MKLLDIDNTLSIHPTAHHYDSVSNYPDTGEFIFWDTNMLDNVPINPCTLINGQTNVVEIRTEGSGVIGIAGSNIENIEVQIYDGTVHDGNDLVLNSALDDWAGGYSSPPDDWTCETNCNYSGGGALITVGEYVYNDKIFLDTPTTTTNRSFKQTCVVAEETKYKLSILYEKDHAQNAQYFIYDNSNGAYIEDNVQFPNPTEEDKTSTIGFLHVVFETPENCVSITIGFHPEGMTGSGDTVTLYGISLRVCAESFTSVDISGTGILSGAQFNKFLKEYTEIAGKHSIVIVVDTSEDSIRIGNIKTGILAEYADPLAGMGQGLKSGSVVTEMPFSGPLVYKIYNPDTFNITINLLENDANNFMFELTPRIHREPIWWIIGDLSGQAWTIYAKFSEDLPEVVETNGDKQKITFTLEEAL